MDPANGGMPRRSFLALGGAVFATAALTACGGGDRPVEQAPTEVHAPTVAELLAGARGTVQIGHRGAGGVAPEHTLASYARALDDGARCLEVSTALTKDGVLVCHHDLTLDRMTDATGRIADRTRAELADVHVEAPWLGPGWSDADARTIPTLDEALDLIGGRAVLCLESKDDAGFGQLLETIDRRGLRDSVVAKLHYRSARIDEAHERKLPVFSYFGNGAAIAPEAVTAAAKRLHRGQDVLVLPARTTAGARPDDAVLQAGVRSGLPVWVYPVHRRSDIDYFHARGVQGVITADHGYTAGTVAPLKTDGWADGRLPAGDLVKDPYSPYDALAWPEPGVVELPRRDKPGALLLGSLAAPGRVGDWRMEFDLSVAGAGPGPVTVAFGHGDDRYYEDGLPTADGYHARLLAAGGLQLGYHLDDGPAAGTPLTADVPSAPLAPGGWVRYRVAMAGGRVSFGPVDGPTISAADERFRGGYVHVVRSAAAPAVRLRGVTLA